MKKYIKILGSSIAFFLCLSILAFANTDDEVINIVKERGIMSGTDNGFEADKTLTRAEITTIVVRMKDMENEAINEYKYVDVNKTHWAYKTINIATKSGITKGVGNNEFAPSREVTVAETVTMLVRAVADTSELESSGTWPNNYMNFAKENGLLEGIVKDKDDIIQRIDTARIIANILNSPNWSDDNKADSKEEIEDTEGNEKIQISKAAAGVIVSIATMADDYNLVELATPYGIVELTAHDSELTSGSVLPGTYVDFWLSGDRMWDIVNEPVTEITKYYNMAKVINFSDGVVKLVKKTTVDGTEVVDAPEYVEANNIIFLECNEMGVTELGTKDLENNDLVLRSFDDLQFGNKNDIELATDFKGLTYTEIDATEVFYQSIIIDDEERIVAMIYEN